MSPTRESNFPEERSRDHGAAAQAPPQTPRRTAGVRPALRRPRPTPPSTVWPCAQNPLQQGTGLIVTWLLTAIIKIVTSYTRSGNHILLVTAPSFVRRGPRLRPTPNRTETPPSAYRGLLEASWSVARLGRTVQTLTAADGTDTLDGGPDWWGPEPESAFGPLSTGRDADTQSVWPTDHRHRCDTVPPRPGSDRFDLIITAVEPLVLGRLDLTAWVGLLNPTGILAVITHGDRIAGRLNDPAGPLMYAEHVSGLRYLDRIALLRAPVRHGGLATSPPAARDQHQATASPPATPVWHERVHDDLFVFTCGVRDDEADLR